MKGSQGLCSLMTEFEGALRVCGMNVEVWEELDVGKNLNKRAHPHKKSLGRHGAPPITARHLQKAIVGSTLMYGSEITWRGQK